MSFEPGFGRLRKSTIMDDDEAIALAQPTLKLARPTKVKAVRKGKETAVGPSAPPTRVAATHWQGDGMRIPLFHPDGKRRSNARQTSSLMSKNTRIQLLEIVKEYAGEANYNRLKEDNTAAEIAAWIEEAETKALGPPRGKRNVISKQNDIEESAMQGVIVAMQDDSDDERNNLAGGKQKSNVQAKSQIHLGSASRKNTPAELSPFYTPSAVARPHPTMPRLPQHTKKDTIDPRELEKYKAHNIGDRHPLIDILNLDPNHPTKHTIVINIPQTQERVVVTATSLTSVIQTYVPMNPGSRATFAQPSSLYGHRYLKKGPHGWDHKKNRWYFYNDKDLQTGMGHEIEPEDEVRLREDPTYRKEFDEKYPGRGAADKWPCGCPKPRDEDESEEE
ncbi:hypothetical protein BDV96DRAFT_599466 [Lophiotrema nucula]|uniref:Uncharacterized protein n=1 Tax=Lophiotrema nucula TaxID=690887 RepID=A0A6A5ZBW9_9PLEO|nr:hypothetical protein BDV96DRAFT_599466 [Lophiotrema nucula]